MKEISLILNSDRLKLKKSSIERYKSKLLFWIHFWKRCFSTFRVSPSVRTRQLGPVVYFGMLELTYRLQTYRDYSFSSWVPCEKRSISKQYRDVFTSILNMDYFLCFWTEFNRKIVYFEIWWGFQTRYCTFPQMTLDHKSQISLFMDRFD